MNTQKYFRILSTVLVLALPAFLQSCASSNGTGASPAPEPTRGVLGIEKGRTTKVELLALLGPPDETRQVGEQEAWWYSPQTRNARAPQAHPGGGASSGAAGAVGKSMAMGGIGVILGQLIPGGSNLGGAVAAGMARSGIMSAGSQAVNKSGEAIRAKDEEQARQTLVVLFTGDVVSDYAFADTAVLDSAGPQQAETIGEDSEQPAEER